MLTLIAAFLFVLAGFDVDAGEVTAFNFLAFGLVLLALHLAYPIGLPARRP